MEFVRLFAAIVPPPEVLSAVEPIARRAHRDIPAKGAWVKPERMHMTLRFFGDRFRQEDCIRMVADGVAGSAPFTLRLTEFGGFPPSRLKRVLFLKPEPDGTLSNILAGLRDPSEQNDTPHLTLARFNQPVELPRIKFDPIEWRVEAVTLINSMQFGAERRYSVVEEWRLG